MKLFGPLYRTTIQWSRHPKAPWYLGGLSFAESSFFPIPPDIMLAPMAMTRPNRWFQLALITSIASVLGGLLGYLIGFGLFKTVAPYLEASRYWASYETAVNWFTEYGVWTVLIAGFSPVPFKVFTLAAGAMNMAILPFVLASIVGRSSRFFLVAGLMAWGGEKMEATLHRYVEWLGWASVLLIALGVWWLKS